MTRITNTEQVLILLRAQLERAQRSGRKRFAPVKGRNGPMERVRELAAADSLSESEIARVLISGLLAEDFGPEFAVDPRFASLVDDVQRLLESDEAGRTLLKRAIATLGAETG